MGILLHLEGRRALFSEVWSTFLVGLSEKVHEILLEIVRYLAKSKEPTFSHRMNVVLRKDGNLKTAKPFSSTCPGLPSPPNSWLQ